MAAVVTTSPWVGQAWDMCLLASVGPGMYYIESTL